MCIIPEEAEALCRFAYFFRDGDDYSKTSDILDIGWWPDLEPMPFARSFSLTAKKAGTATVVIYGEQLPFKGPYYPTNYECIIFEEFTVQVTEPGA